MITLDLNHFGFQRAGQPERRKKSRGDSKRKRKRVEDPGPTSMVVSWVGACKARATRGGGLDFEYASGTHKGGGLQARANLNGGKLDKEPSAEIGEV